jgi:hypothetical protein
MEMIKWRYMTIEICTSTYQVVAGKYTTKQAQLPRHPQRSSSEYVLYASPPAPHLLLGVLLHGTSSPWTIPGAFS